MSGPSGTSGSFVVTPTATTTYTLTANGPNNATSNCSVTVTVNAANTGVPRVIRFTAAPTTIVAGQTSSLVWQVENADTVTISGGVGNVDLVGTKDVSPQQTTTYTLTATNKNGNTTATATVTVTPAAPVSITTFTANPPVSPAPGSPVTLTCVATGANTVTIAGAGALSAQGTVVVNPTVDTTYTCTAVGANGAQAVKTLTVTVTPTGPPPPAGPPPTVVISGGPVIETAVRTVQLDASQSTSPAGFTPLTYYWTSRDGRAALITPHRRPQLSILATCSAIISSTSRSRMRKAISRPEPLT